MKLNINLLMLSFIVGLHIQLHAQTTSTKLVPTTIIGTMVSLDYSNSSQSTTVNTINNVFDGDMNSYFASYVLSGGWVGLDLGEKHVITKLTFCPREGQKQRMLLGVFEGANNPDFGDAVPLMMITEALTEKKMTEQVVTCSKGFRYVRYIGPNGARCNIAEVEFYGYPGNGDDSKFNQITNLPAVIIHTKDAVDIVDPYKEVYRKGVVSFISGNGTKIYTDSTEIKGRGNASWTFPKKPYRLKLYNKAKVLDLPATEKNWTLINNYGDKTLMRNLLAFDLSKRLEMPYTPAGILVNVFLNGEYKGCYQLCDQIEVAKNRVDVEKMDPKDIALPKLSGGYLVEIDAYASGEISWFSSQKGVPVTVKYPKDDEIVTQQYDYIKSYFNEMEAALFSTSYKDEKSGYRKYIDMETFIRHFLVGEISGNTDTYWSVYMYKKRDEDVFHFGPVWDFDIAFENDNRTYPINSNTNWIYASTGSEAYGVRNMVNRLFTDTEFINKLRTTYADYRNRGIITEEALIGVVDNYAEELDESQKLNFTRWNIMNQIVHMNPRTYGSYAAEVENVRAFIKGRIKWMDKKLSYTPDGIPTSIEDNFSPDIYVWTQTNSINIEGITQPTHIEIISSTGGVLFSKTINNNLSIPSVKGIFMVRFSYSKAKSKVIKCIVL